MKHIVIEITGRNFIIGTMEVHTFDTKTEVNNFIESINNGNYPEDKWKKAYYAKPNETIPI